MLFRIWFWALYTIYNKYIYVPWHWISFQENSHYMISNVFAHFMTMPRLYVCEFYACSISDESDIPTYVWDDTHTYMHMLWKLLLNTMNDPHNHICVPCSWLCCCFRAFAFYHANTHRMIYRKNLSNAANIPIYRYIIDILV